MRWEDELRHEKYLIFREEFRKAYDELYMDSYMDSIEEMYKKTFEIVFKKRFELYPLSRTQEILVAPVFGQL